MQTKNTNLVENLLIKKLNIHTYHDSQGWKVHKDVEDYAYKSNNEPSVFKAGYKIHDNKYHQDKEHNFS